MVLFEWLHIYQKPVCWLIAMQWLYCKCNRKNHGKVNSHLFSHLWFFQLHNATKKTLALTWKETQLFTNELNPYSWQRLFSSIFALFNMNHTQAWLPDRCIQEVTREGIKAAKEDHYAIKCQILWGYLQQCQLRERKSFALVTICRQKVYTFFHKQISSLVYKTNWAEVSFIEEAREYI